MQELMIGIAMLLPEETLVEHITESLENFKIDPTDKNKKTLAANCMLFAVRISTEGKDLQTVMNEVAEKKRIISAHEYHKG